MEFQQRWLLESDRVGGGSSGSDTPTSTIIESTNTEWTDEKHNQYLSFIEESFVNQLYSHESHLATRKYLQTSELNFKVQKRGCWGQISFKTLRPQTNNVNESRMLSSNSWIKHFRSPHASRGSECQEDEGTSFEPIPSPKKLCFCSKNLRRQKTTAVFLEASDQNFADNDMEVEKKFRGTKRLKNGNNIVFDSDQIVLLSSSKSSSKGNSSSLKRMRE